MQLHANAALSLNGRRALIRALVEDGLAVAEAAARFAVSEKTARKWRARWEAEGDAGLLDRSSAPHTVWNRTASERIAAITKLRALRFTGPQIADIFEMADSTVSGLLTRAGLGKLGRLGLEPAVRYERERPGELIHIDVKKLGQIKGGAGKRATGRKHYTTTFTDRDGKRRRTAGWEFVHIAIDDCTRLAYAEILGDEKGTTAAGFLKRAIAFFERHGIQVERVLTDNGSPYISAVHAVACRALKVKHLRTRPRRPQTNGKAERFIRTMLGGWAYSGATYASSVERARALDGWLYEYNHRRRHTALGRKTPIARLTERNNLLRSYI
jgi:transposase InsO family protein